MPVTNGRLSIVNSSRFVSALICCFVKYSVACKSVEIV
jgi:hypothetical protein